MASTYTLISSNVLSSSAASVTFSSIPATYTDLVLRGSIRSTTAIDGSLTFNGTGGTVYSRTYLRGDGSTAGSSRNSSTAQITLDDIYRNGSNTTNTFASFEIYIPNYLASTNKPVYYDGADETNGTAAYRYGIAGLFRDTTAISSLSIAFSTNAVSSSSFYLYGIKNS
jgi:hypothetical protein